MTLLFSLAVFWCVILLGYLLVLRVLNKKIYDLKSQSTELKIKRVERMIIVERLNDELIQECESLLSENHAVSGHFDFPLDIDWKMYLAMGSDFLTFTIRDRGDLVGMLFFYLANYPHHQSLRMAQQVTFYIKPGFRQHSFLMMEQSEKHLQDMGIDIVVQAARANTHFKTTLEKRGYLMSDIFYTKILDDNVKKKTVKHLAPVIEFNAEKKKRRQGDL